MVPSNSPRTFALRTMIDHRTRATERLSLFTRLGFARRTVNRTSTLHCPYCRAGSHERMPMDRTLHEFQCLWCNRLVQQGPEEHCIYCAFGSRKCPQMQRS